MPDISYSDHFQTIGVLNGSIYGFELFAFACLGLLLGSFATALTYRVARGLPWASFSGKDARSYCPACQHSLSVFDLVPLFSWLFQRGRCRYCAAAIPVRYPLIELCSLALCLMVFLTKGFTVEAFLIAALVPFLLSMAVIDLEKFILPNQMMLGAAVISILYAAWHAYLAHDIVVFGFLLLSGVIYAATAWALSLLMRFILKKEALGFGDVKFFGVAGICLGLQYFSLFLIASGLLGVVFALVWRALKKQKYFPFGPSIIAAFYLLLVFS